ncbi:bifunctional riboflavin kinase/FAD synthetase [Paracoccus sp. 1_MG-2023]|uniref:bifunctional riboflavin kinase/FAD synthetase n=1 Tax=unclassified Paracoccus (in: a-proteobacteria) TaxID=2688777 RepID=UPI001C08BD5A|nr:MULTISPECIES: bifunctional riboflavin kinase/FAD synthetase [unclassified Paracoccus (in: a-proteobacteria)]MBU2956744.1 bifunctional riboflavin kinase/FAD synthetase [Paracoccus sp. C2R09]MDO6669217.1 bifunctional riboflavin kinase/FAD synthetase [Paracoccus sp. 1_MG-2023]
MHIHRDWHAIAADAKGASVAMGNFDGVHLGHRAVIDTARAATDGPLGVVTFEPHPREVFKPDGPSFRLMNAESRANRLARLAVDHLYELPFGPELAGLSPEAFAQQVLVDGLGVSHVTVGADFKFGAKRAGDAVMLMQLGQQLGFGVTVQPLIQSGDAVYSSTAIRQALTEGRTREAERMLGHWHRIDGEVIHGEKRGRQLGWRTANMAMEGLHLPRLGVYAVLVDILTGPNKGPATGVASIGVRPMFGKNAPNLEVHLFDFDGDLYGQHLSVALVEFLRDEMAFDGVDMLVQQIEADATCARDILAGR